jgi:hypothetical protein
MGGALEAKQEFQLDELFALHRTEIVRLKAELAEARAHTNFWENKYTELEAQIAAKDAGDRGQGCGAAGGET